MGCTTATARTATTTRCHGLGAATAGSAAAVITYRR
jgi:hypothetical protein